MKLAKFERGPMAVKSEFLQVNRLQLHYREWGNPKDKHALIFLHGFAATSRIWDEIAEELAKDFRVIAVDQRGHGRSDLDPNHDYSRTNHYFFCKRR